MSGEPSRLGVVDLECCLLSDLWGDEGMRGSVSVCAPLERKPDETDAFARR